MTVGLWVLVVAVVVATGFGTWRALTDGRIRGTHRVHGVENVGDELASAEPSSRPWADDLGERATLVQFSSAFCAPCRTTRQVLANVAEATAGVRHVEIDAEHHLDLVRELGILRTPTTLILDAEGRERFRATGVPRRDQVLRSL